MSKSLLINFKILDDFLISAEEFLLMYRVYTNQGLDMNIDLTNLQEKQLLKLIVENDEIKIILRQKAIDLIESLLIEVEDIKIDKPVKIKKSKRLVNKDVEENITEFRNIWKGLKPGSMGSLKSCKVKLTRWMLENPEYTFDQINQAARLYIDNLHGDYRFLQRADYFIFKQESNKEEASRLSAFVDDLDGYNNTEWTSQIN